MKYNTYNVTYMDQNKPDEYSMLNNAINQLMTRLSNKSVPSQGVLEIFVNLWLVYHGKRDCYLYETVEQQHQYNLGLPITNVEYDKSLLKEVEDMFNGVEFINYYNKIDSNYQNAYVMYNPSDLGLKFLSAIDDCSNLNKNFMVMQATILGYDDHYCWTQKCNITKKVIVSIYIHVNTDDDIINITEPIYYCTICCCEEHLTVVFAKLNNKCRSFEDCLSLVGKVPWSVEISNIHNNDRDANSLPQLRVRHAES
jgi:hypothetical protein